MSIAPLENEHESYENNLKNNIEINTLKINEILAQSAENNQMTHEIIDIINQIVDNVETSTSSTSSSTSSTSSSTTLMSEDLRSIIYSVIIELMNRFDFISIPEEDLDNIVEIIFNSINNLDGDEYVIEIINNIILNLLSFGAFESLGISDVDINNLLSAINNIPFDFIQNATIDNVIMISEVIIAGLAFISNLPVNVQELVSILLNQLSNTEYELDDSFSSTMESLTNLIKNTETDDTLSIITELSNFITQITNVVNTGVVTPQFISQVFNLYLNTFPNDIDELGGPQFSGWGTAKLHKKIANQLALSTDINLSEHNSALKQYVKDSPQLDKACYQVIITPKNNIENNKKYFYGFGRNNLIDQQKINKDQPQVLGSLSKILTNLIIDTIENNQHSDITNLKSIIANGYSKFPVTNRTWTTSDSIYNLPIWYEFFQNTQHVPAAYWNLHDDATDTERENILSNLEPCENIPTIFTSLTYKMNTIPQIQTVFCLLNDWLYSVSSGNDKSILSQIISMFPDGIKQMILNGGPKISVNMKYLIYKYILGPDAPAEIIPFYKSNVDKFYNRETQAQEPQSAKDFLRKFMQNAPMTADYGDKIPRLEAQYYDNSHDYCLTTLEQYYNHGKTNSDPATLLEYIQTRILVHMVPPEKVSEFSFETEFGIFQSPLPNTVAPTIENQILGAKDLDIFYNQILKEQLNTPYEIFLTESVKNLGDKSELLGSSGFTCSSNLLCSIYQHYSNNNPTSFLTYKQDGTIGVFVENDNNEITYYILGQGYDQQGGYVCWGPAGSKRNGVGLSNNINDQLPTYGWGGFFSQRLQVDNFKDDNNEEFQIISYQSSYQDIFGLSFQSFILKKIGTVLNTLMPPATTAPNDLQNNLTTIITNLTTIFNLEISEENINQIVTTIANIDSSQNIIQVLTEIVLIIAIQSGTQLGIPEENITNFTDMITSIDYSQNINQVIAEIVTILSTQLGIPEEIITNIIAIGTMIININSDGMTVSFDELIIFVENMIRDPLSTVIYYLENTTITELFQLSNVFDSIINIINNLSEDLSSFFGSDFDVSNSTIVEMIATMFNTNPEDLMAKISDFIIVLTTDATLVDVGISNDDVLNVLNVFGQVLNVSTDDIYKIQSLLFLLINNNILQMFGVTQDQLINVLFVIFNINIENFLSEIRTVLNSIIEFSNQSLINILDLILPDGTLEQITSILPPLQ